MVSFRSLLTGFLVLLPFIALLIAISGRHPMPSAGTVPSDGMAVIAVGAPQLVEPGASKNAESTVPATRQDH
jgi:hypothetical protein